jgi:cytochrome oxidase Cu insertion factor (SCO1/SenC/PrrC family)
MIQKRGRGEARTVHRVLSVLLGMILLFGGCLGSDTDDFVDLEFNGTEYNHPVIAPDFTLVDQHGENLTLSDLRGKVVVVAFTYTHCPDVCLAVENNLAYIHQNLGVDAGDVVLISITIDPARDTVERFANWTALKGFEWPHLTEDNHSHLAEVWNDWHLIVDNDYLSDHDNSNHHPSNGSENNETADNSSNQSGNSTGAGPNGSNTTANHSAEEGHSGEADGGDDHSDLDAVEQYEVGHSTVTFIVDKSGNKRVAWLGADWNADKFLEDIRTLVNSE